MSELHVSPLDHAAALAITRWRYPPPYDLYTLSDDPLGTALFLSSAASGYFQLRDAAGELVAFCCFGAEAQVPGGDYSTQALDLGLGLRPDLTGRGHGMRYLGAVLAFGIAQFQPTLLRLTVADFNLRAIRLYQKAGFHAAARFTSSFARRPFIIMTRYATIPPPQQARRHP